MKEYDKYVGKRFTWKEIVGMFPNKWVALSDYEFKDNSRIKAGVLRAVCKDSEVIEVEKEIAKKYNKLFWKRTTEVIEGEYDIMHLG